MTADIITLADFVVETLEGLLGSGSDTEVQRVWSVTRKMGTFTGRKVDVYPDQYNRTEPETRLEDFYEGYLVIAIWERYEERSPEGDFPVPNEWVDERVNYVEQEIYNPLQAARIEWQVGSSQYTYRCFMGEVVVVCDPQLLRQHKVFSSEIRLGFRQLKEGEV